LNAYILSSHRIFKGEMMAHYYYVDHSRQQCSGESESSDLGNNQQLPFYCSQEIHHGKYYLFGQAIWIICQLLSKILSLIFVFFLQKNFFVLI
jgi:hypothetical protein